MLNDDYLTVAWCAPLWATVANLNTVYSPCKGGVGVALMKAYMGGPFQKDSLDPVRGLVSVFFCLLTSLLHLIPFCLQDKMECIVVTVHYSCPPFSFSGYTYSQSSSSPWRTDCAMFMYFSFRLGNNSCTFLAYRSRASAMVLLVAWSNCVTLIFILFWFCCPSGVIQKGKGWFI